MVILEAISGPITGRQIEVQSGSILRIGRTVKSDYAVSSDSYMSGLHFAVDSSGPQCKVKDMGSSNGTFVNGVKVSEVVVKDGDTIAAGGCTFSVRLMDDAVMPDFSGTRTIASANTAKLVPEFLPPQQTTSFARPTPAQMTGRGAGFSSAHKALLDSLYTENEPIFGLMDASRESRIPAFLDASGEPYARVCPAVPGAAGHPVHPYLVFLPDRTRLLDVLIKDGWGHGWGVYLSSQSQLEEVRAHICECMLLRTAMGRAFYLRSFDPSVLAAILPSFSPRECKEFFGPIQRFVVETERGDMAIDFRMTQQGLVQRRLPLGS